MAEQQPDNGVDESSAESLGDETMSWDELIDEAEQDEAARVAQQTADTPAPTVQVASPSVPDEVVGDEPGMISVEIADLYVHQGEYARGVEMYQQLLEQTPDDQSLKDRLQDAELLAELLTVPDEQQTYDKGFREGYQVAQAGGGAVTKDEKVARLSAWLDRVKQARG